MVSLTVIPKRFERSSIKNSDIVFRDRELIVEYEGNDVSNQVLRFKIGDGIHQYKDLSYVSSLYALYPHIMLYDSNYTHCIKMEFSGEVTDNVFSNGATDTSG